MISNVSFALPHMPRLGDTRPQMPPLTTGRAITPDRNGVSNTDRAAGASLVTRVLADTSQINGLGGSVDVVG